MFIFGAQTFSFKDEPLIKHFLRPLITMTTPLQNPILPGFNPDPAICKKGDTYYIAVSSFQWWPGIPVYESKDLRNWKLSTYILKDINLVDLRRIGDSAGIWAPAISYADGLFWVVFSPATGSRLHGHESANYLTYSESIDGPWAEPVFMSASGNDASLFHDDDGKKYFLNTHLKRGQLTPDRIDGHCGTLMQEYDHQQKKLVGKARNIFAGTDAGIPEGSKMYKRNNYYYLNIAEGGTEYGHCMTLARSKNVNGPYEVHPENPILTAVDEPDNPIQRAGHADFIEVPNNGGVALVYLASRPVDGCSVLGRETYIAKAHWGEDDWLRLESRAPVAEVPDFGLPAQAPEALMEVDDFDSPELHLEWNTLRQPIKDLIDLESRPSWLQLKPTYSFLDSMEKTSAIFRRVRHHRFSASTRMQFEPHTEQQWAGLTCYYDTRHWYYAFLGVNEEGELLVGLCKKGYGMVTEHISHKILDRAQFPDGIIDLQVQCDSRTLQFQFKSPEEDTFKNLGEPQDATILSDEYVESKDPDITFGFTGAYVGLACWDLPLTSPKAAFDSFVYRGEDD